MLIAAEVALDDVDLELAAEALDDYARWRRRGGFEPEVPYLIFESPDRGGDAFHQHLTRRLRKLRKLRER